MFGRAPTRYFRRNPFAVGASPRIVQNGFGGMTVGAIALASLAMNAIQFKKLSKYSLENAVNSSFVFWSKYALRCEADINAKSKNGRNMLQLAIKNGDIDMSNFLIDSGISLNVQDNDGYTALHNAVWFGQIDIAKKLIHKRASTNLVNKYGRPPLYSTVMSPTLDYFAKINLMMMLIDNGADINIQDIDGNTVLHSLCQVAKSIEHTGLVRKLLEFGANPLLLNADGQPPTSFRKEITTLLKNYSA